MPHPPWAPPWWGLSQHFQMKKETRRSPNLLGLGGRDRGEAGARIFHENKSPNVNQHFPNPPSQARLLLQLSIYCLLKALALMHPRHCGPSRKGSLESDDPFPPFPAKERDLLRITQEGQPAPPKASVKMGPEGCSAISAHPAGPDAELRAAAKSPRGRESPAGPFSGAVS